MYFKKSFPYLCCDWKLGPAGWVAAAPWSVWSCEQWKKKWPLSQPWACSAGGIRRYFFSAGPQSIQEMPLCVCCPHHSLRDQSVAGGPRSRLVPPALPLEPPGWHSTEPQSQGMVETTAGCGTLVQPPCSSKVIPNLERIASQDASEIGAVGAWRTQCSLPRRVIHKKPSTALWAGSRTPPQGAGAFWARVQAVLCTLGCWDTSARLFLEHTRCGTRMAGGSWTPWERSSLANF